MDGTSSETIQITPEAELQSTDIFTFPYASRGFHHYRNVWIPKIDQQLEVQHEKNNLHDPYACALFAKSRNKINGKVVVGHIPREISRFCKFFVEYGGELLAHVTSTSFRRSPVPQGGLEIPICLQVKRSAAPEMVFKKMKQLVDTHYLEPDKIPSTVEMPLLEL